MDNQNENTGVDLSGGSTADSLYLSQLKYTKKVSKTFLNFFIQNFRVIVLIILMILSWGLFSYTQLPLESNPEVKIPFGIITATLPGASPSDVEELVVKKIEDKVSNITGVKQVTATAYNSLAVVSVEFRAEENLDDAMRRLRDSVANLKSDLPTDATDPVVQEVSFSNTPVWTVEVTGPYDNFTLRKYADMIKDELKKMPGTSEADVSGGDVYEDRIVYDPAKLQEYNLTADQVNQIVKADNFSLPLGTIDISNYEYTIRTEGKINNADDLRNLPILSTNGQTIYLKDVANVAEMAQKRDVYSKFSLQGGDMQNAVSINIIKKTGSSIIDLIDGGKAKIEELKKDKLPKDLNVESTLDQSKIIRRDFDQLVHDGVMTIILVTVILFLFVGLKEAFVAGLAVPMVFCATFGLMLLTGVTLNFLSLFSLILSLGLLVDDAIVVVQATKQYLKTGKFTPEEAVLLVFNDYKVLLATTTLTTIWAFLPLLMATGIIGQFIRSIPITVSLTLASSFFIAILINHPMAIILERFRITRGPIIAILIGLGLGTLALLVSFIKGSTGILGLIPLLIVAIMFFALLILYRKSLRNKLIENEDLVLQEKADDDKIKAKIYHHYLASDDEKSTFAKLIGGIIKLDNVLPYYGNVLEKILKSKALMATVLVVVAVLFIGAASLPVTGVLKSEFIPPADSEYLYINVEGAPGLVTDQTKKVTDQIATVLRTEKTISSFSLIVGAGGVNVSDRSSNISGAGGETNKAQFAINFYPLKERPASGPNGKVEESFDIAKRIRAELEPIKGAKITVVEVAGGPPSGADFQAQIVGDDMQTLEKLANKYKDMVSQIPGTVNQTTSISLSPGEFNIKIDQQKLSDHGMTVAQIAGALRSAISGTDLSTILRNSDEITINAQYDQNKISTIEDIENLSFLNNRGQQFYLKDVASVTLEPAITTIDRIDEKRVITLSASVIKPQLPSEVLKKFQEMVAKDPPPTGYEILYGGQNETNTESVLSILRAMVIAMLLIVATLVIQFNSFRKAILVLATIPLAMTGVFYGLAVIHFTLSFPGLIGILALFGIVVKNAVILVDKINLNLKVGIGFIDAIVDASKSRMEAIFLTSICTIIGMLPLTLNNETWEGLGASLIFGLATSTFLTLLVIPILFNIFLRGSHKKDERLAELKAQKKV